MTTIEETSPVLLIHLKPLSKSRHCIYLIVMIILLTLCILGKVAYSSAVCLLFFSNSTFSKKYFRNTISVKQFGSRSGPTFFGPDLGPNCLKMLSADDTSWQSSHIIYSVHGLNLLAECTIPTICRTEGFFFHVCVCVCVCVFNFYKNLLKANSDT